MTTVKIKTPIIPSEQKFCTKGNDSGLDLKAICIFAAAGFFLAEDTYYRNLKALQPATEYEFDDNDELLSESPYWKWHHTPLKMTLEDAVDEFAELFERITSRLLGSCNVILPLSGGLDSRTQAAVLKDPGMVHSYSYRFEDSFDETKYGEEIAKLRGFRFSSYVIPRGYLWKRLEQISGINKCYADFTHPRQMAHIEELSTLGDIFYLGHWGDVLFDDMGLPESLSFDEQVSALQKKILKRGGMELADSLWKAWGIEGTFEDHLKGRLAGLLAEIKIENVNARIRAFKSMYWAPRWTSANMNAFSSFKPVAIPYYDDEMCRFVCTVPEELLADRKIQIEYIKKISPELATVAWQDYDPLNLYNYGKFESPSMLPYRALRKGKNIVKRNLFGRKLVTRNWEIQFCGEENDRQLRERLFGGKNFSEFIPSGVVKSFYDKFKQEDEVKYSHPVSMLLTLSEFCRMNLN